MTPVTTFAGKTVALFGLGGSGLATALALKAGGARVIACDDNPAKMVETNAQGIETADLRDADWSQFSSFILSPGVPLTHPEPHWSAKLAREAGVEIIGDIELFCRERAKIAPNAPFIAITGTNGKSTTTALIAHILREWGQNVQMGGNIGTAILSLQPPADNVFHIIEVSSFQIDLAPSINPTIGVLLNISPDHLDRHGSMENYAAIKERMIAQSQHAVVSIDDQWTSAIANKRATRITPFTVSDIIFQGFNGGGRSIFEIDKADRWIYTYATSIDKIASLRGEHNQQNAVAAIAALKQLSEWLLWSHGGTLTDLVSAEKLNEIMSVNLSDGELQFLSKKKRHAQQIDFSMEEFHERGLIIRKLPKKHERVAVEYALKTFPGLPHRMEEVGRIGEALFINDSKATNADSTEKALKSFDDIFWILGGKAKEGGIEPLKSYFPKIRKAYLIGAASDDFARTLGNDVPHVHCGTLDKAVEQAASDAQALGAHAVVLLSPACASYDQFPNYEVRGNHFRDLVRGLPGIEAKGA